MSYTGFFNNFICTFSENCCQYGSPRTSNDPAPPSNLQGGAVLYPDHKHGREGGGEAPKALSGKILMSAYWLFVILMLATFSANLAAFLTVETLDKPIESVEDLAAQVV